MKRLSIAVVGLGVIAAITLAQPGTYKVHTCPRLPSTEALERMGLKLHWQTRVLLTGNRDGFFTVQLVPAGDALQILVQTYSGMVVLFDGETGDELWRAQAGAPYQQSLPAAASPSALKGGTR